MKLGLQIPNFTWGLAPAAFASRLGEVANEAEAAGYSSIWLMDHLFQIPNVGPAQNEMLEAYTALGFLAAHTKTARLGTMVTGVTYRHPGILAKQVTTLDVLSGGRAMLGIGAAWYEREHLGLGIPFPPLRERFERLEEALKVCLQMWSDDVGPCEGKHYRLAETLNSPQSISRPHPPILIGGGGEKKTLRLVAKYADACNIFGESPEFVRRKFDIIRQHCDDVGRDYASIEKTVLTRVNVGPNGEHAGRELERLGALAEAGTDTAIGYLAGCETLRPFQTVARDLVPQLAKL
ncbi:MAG: LLM class F420-dependent oxidoreductase [Chloroflexi bacterium]|nr:LLM class F420-dependent oxidoreductase [Chloroflexota bacterium]